MIPAIQTRYAGCLFRSRLEARWAVFYDTLGVPWEYEKEGFELPSGCYLPDFWLPEQDCWVEIKGEICGLEKCEELALLTRKRVLMFYGNIPDPRMITVCGSVYSADAPGDQGAIMRESFTDENGVVVVGGEDHYWWCMGCCETPGVEFDGRGERVVCRKHRAPRVPGGKGYSANANKILKAYVAARSARFDLTGAPAA